jgi:two-component system chemotaxis response regulator CheY
MSRPQTIERRSTARNAEAADSAVVRQIAPAWRCQVLVADDDSIVGMQLATLLGRIGFDVRVANSGAEALRILDTTGCQILITDWQMPDMDGLALCRRVRSQHREGYVYVLMLTVRAAKEDLLQGLAAGADDFMVKGASVDEFLARMEVARRITRLEYSLRKSNRENLRLAVTDSLTGTHNRRYLLEHLPRELERARRYRHPLALLCCDIDEFKTVNDRFGHAAGDAVLQAFVAAARRCTREASDWVARSGGDEFIVVLPETNLDGATAMAQRLRARVAAHPAAGHRENYPFTISVGVTAVESAAELAAASVASLLRTVDEGAYASKRCGRNQVTALPAQLP